MEMAEETQIRESRGSRRGAPGGRNRKPNIKVLAFLLLAVCCTAGAAAGVYLSRQRAAPVSQQGLTLSLIHIYYVGGGAGVVCLPGE